MKTTILSSMFLSAAIAFAVNSAAGAETGSPAGPLTNQAAPSIRTNIITIHQNLTYGVDDLNSKRTNSLAVRWALLDENQDGALFGMKVKTRDFIEWRLRNRRNSFSLAVTNRADWIVKYGDTNSTDNSNWRTNAPLPFAATNYGVVDSRVKSIGNDEIMTVQLRYVGSGAETIPYQIVIPPIPIADTNSPFLKPFNYYNLLEATLIWDGTKNPE